MLTKGNITDSNRTWKGKNRVSKPSEFSNKASYFVRALLLRPGRWLRSKKVVTMVYGHRCMLTASPVLRCSHARNSEELGTHACMQPDWEKKKVLWTVMGGRCGLWRPEQKLCWLVSQWCPNPTVVVLPRVFGPDTIQTWTMHALHAPPYPSPFPCPTWSGTTRWYGGMIFVGFVWSGASSNMKERSRVNYLYQQ